MAADSDPALQISETAIPSILTREVTERTIEPFSSCSVDIIFSPEVALDQSTEFIADFSHPSVAPVRYGSLYCCSVLLACTVCIFNYSTHTLNTCKGV